MSGETSLPERPLRERKKRRTRDAVIEAALRLFVEKGFDATTVEEIAAAAEVAPRTFYRYFPTKEAVIFLDQELENEAIKQALSDRHPGESDLDLLLRTMQQVLAFSAPNLKHMAELLPLMLTTPALLGRTFELTLRGESIFVEGLLANTPRSREAEFRARVLAACVTSMARVVFLWWIESGQRGTISKDFFKALAFLRDGFESVPGGARARAQPAAPRASKKRRNGPRAV